MLILDAFPDRPVHTVAFSRDGRSLASVSGRSPHVVFWDLFTCKASYTLCPGEQRVVALAFSPTGDLFAALDHFGALCVWWRSSDSPDGRWSVYWQGIWRRQEGQHAPGQLTFSPDGKLLATTLRDERPSIILVLDLEARKFRNITTPHHAEVSSLCFSPDGKTLVTGSFDRTLALGRPRGRLREVLQHHQKVHFLGFSPDGTTLASGSVQGLVRLWDTAAYDCRATLNVKPWPVHALCFSPDGQTLATAGGALDGIIHFWDVASGTRRGQYAWEVGELHSVAFAPDGMRAAAGGVGKIVIWDIDDWIG